MVKGKDEFMEWVKAIIIAFILAFIIRSFLFETTLVEGYSMLPTLHNKDRIIVNKLIYRFNSPEHGDIIVFKNPDNLRENYVKRVIGISGDSIEIKNGRVYLNDEVLEESYVMEASRGDFPKVLIPPDTIFVMGDNRNHSQDSRSPRVGFVPLKNILGKAQLRIWPLDDIKWFD